MHEKGRDPACLRLSLGLGAAAGGVQRLRAAGAPLRRGLPARGAPAQGRPRASPGGGARRGPKAGAARCEPAEVAERPPGVGRVVLPEGPAAVQRAPRGTVALLGHTSAALL